jgi:hypothetical protein
MVAVHRTHTQGACLTSKRATRSSVYLAAAGAEAVPAPGAFFFEAAFFLGAVVAFLIIPGFFFGTAFLDGAAVDAFFEIVFLGLTAAVSFFFGAAFFFGATFFFGFGSAFALPPSL